MGKHTIVLVQKTQDSRTRTFMDYESIPAAMDGVCHLFEQFLRQKNPEVRNITYDISDLYTYIDQLGDLSCLCYEGQIQAYQPFNKQWIKERVLAHLQSVAQQR